MKNRHCLMTYFTFLLLLSWCGLASDAHGQQQIDNIVPKELSEQEALHTIARLKSQMYDPSKTVQVLQFQLDVLKSEIHFHARKNEEIRQLNMDSETKISDSNALIRDLISVAESETGMPLVDRETTALLTRNCMIELQRIEWDLAAEQVLLKLKPNKAEIGIARLNVEASKAELDAIKTGFNEIQSLEKSLGKMAFDAKIQEARAKLAVAELKLAETTLQLEALTDTPATDSATKVSQLTERRKAIDVQLALLKHQRQAWLRIESTQMVLNQYRKRSEAFTELQTHSDLQQLTRSNIVHAIEEAIKNGFPTQTSDEKPTSDK